MAAYLITEHEYIIENEGVWRTCTVDMDNGDGTATIPAGNINGRVGVRLKADAGKPNSILWSTAFSKTITNSYVTELVTFNNLIHATSSGAGTLSATSGGNDETEGEGGNFLPVMAGLDYHITWPFEKTGTTYDVDFHAQKEKLNLASALFGLSVRVDGLFKIEDGVMDYLVNISTVTHLRISVMAAENSGMPVLKWSTDNKATWSTYNFTKSWGFPVIGAVRFKENTARITGLEVYYNDGFQISPAVVKPLPDASAVETVEMVYSIPNDTFSDLDNKTSDLTLSASGMPAWMSFTQNGSGGGVLHGIPTAGTAGDIINITIKATDLSGNYVNEVIQVKVYNSAVIEVTGFTVNTQTPQVGDLITFTALKTTGFQKISWELPGSDKPKVDGNSVTVKYSTPGLFKVVMHGVVNENSSVRIEKPFDFMTVFPDLKNPDYYLDIVPGEKTVFNGETLGVRPGDVVCLRSPEGAGSIRLERFIGTEADPIWFTNPTGVQVQVIYPDTGDGVYWINSRNIREAYVNGIQYGLYIECNTVNPEGGGQGHVTVGNSYNHRTYGVEQGRHAFAGFMSKNDPSAGGIYNRDKGFKMWGRWLKHCKIDSNNNKLSALGRQGHEHVYFGHYQLEEPEGSSHYMPDCQIGYNSFKDSGRDNIQIGCVGPTQDAMIYYNVCDGAGLDDIFGQRQNLALNEGFGGYVFGNICKGAVEQFMDLHPFGSTYIFNNVFEKHGYMRIENSSFNGWIDGTGTAKTVSCNLYFFNNTAVGINNAGGNNGVLLRMHESLGDPFTDLLIDNNAFTYVNSGNMVATTILPRAGANNKSRQIANLGELGFINPDNNQRPLPGSILRSGGTDLSIYNFPKKVILSDPDGYVYPSNSDVWFVGAYYDTSEANHTSTEGGGVILTPIDPGTARFKKGIFGLAGRI